MSVKLSTVVGGLLGPRPAERIPSRPEHGAQKVNTALMKPETNLPAPGSNGANPFIAFASGADGVPLRFDAKVGAWKLGLGADAVTIPNGTLVVGQMSYLSHVWSKWEDQKRTGREVAMVGNWEIPKRRDQLDDFDQSFWATDEETGQPKDPWQQSFELPMVNAETDELWIFSTNSKGGVAAVKKLSGAYGRGQNKHPGCYPVIELSSGGYQHPIRSRGYINTPLLSITDWQPRDDASEPPAKSAGEALNDAIPF
jgi:hypothetical protein